MGSRHASGYAGHRGGALWIAAPLLLLVGAMSGGCTGSSPLLESRNVGPQARGPVRGTSYFLPKKLLRVAVWEYTTENPRRGSDGAVLMDADGRPVVDRKVYRFGVHARNGSDELIVPDHRYQFVIAPQWSESADDYLKVGVTQDGLLRDVYGHATDERGEIARGLTDLISMAIAGPGATSKWQPQNRVSPVRGMPGEPSTRPRIVSVYEFDPLDSADRSRVEKALGQYGIRMTLTKQPDCPTATSGPGCGPGRNCRAPGIYYRLPIPYRFTLAPAGMFRTGGTQGARAEGEWDHLEGGLDKTVLLPNEAVCMYAPVDRASFVSAYTSLTFNRGMLASVETDKPSQLLGFVKIPVDVASAILAIPAELLTIRIKRTTDEANLATQQQNALDAEKRKIESEMQLLEAARKMRGMQEPLPDDVWGN